MRLHHKTFHDEELNLYVTMNEDDTITVSIDTSTRYKDFKFVQSKRDVVRKIGNCLLKYADFHGDENQVDINKTI